MGGELLIFDHLIRWWEAAPGPHSVRLTDHQSKRYYICSIQEGRRVQAEETNFLDESVTIR